MRGFQLRKYRRLMFRAFPDLVKPTKRNRVPYVPTPQEDAQAGGCIGIIFLILFIMAIAK
jgi:hypothetical protein